MGCRKRTAPKPCTKIDLKRRAQPLLLRSIFIVGFSFYRMVPRFPFAANSCSKAVFQRAAAAAGTRCARRKQSRAGKSAGSPHRNPPAAQAASAAHRQTDAAAQVRPVAVHSLDPGISRLCRQPVPVRRDAQCDRLPGLRLKRRGGKLRKAAPRVFQQHKLSVTVRRPARARRQTAPPP